MEFSQTFTINFLLSDKERKHYNNASKLEELSLERDKYKNIYQISKKSILNNVKDKYLIKYYKLILSNPVFFEMILCDENVENSLSKYFNDDETYKITNIKDKIPNNQNSAIHNKEGLKRKKLNI